MDLERIKQEVKELDVFTNHCGIKLVDLTLGKAVLESEPVEEFPANNFSGNVHGGFIFTMADVAGGLSVVCYGRNCVTIDSSINFIKGTKSGKLTAEGEVLHKGKSTAVAKVLIYNEKRQPVAAATLTMFLLEEL